MVRVHASWDVLGGQAAYASEHKEVCVLPAGVCQAKKSHARRVGRTVYIYIYAVYDRILDKIPA